MHILGISAYYHDSAAVLLHDEEVLAAAQEERFTRRKHDPSFPHNAIAYCLEEARIGLSEVDRIVFYEKPFLKFERLLETYLSFAPKGLASFCQAMPIWLKEKLFLKTSLLRELQKLDRVLEDSLQQKLLFAEHHQSHAASAFYPSPYREAAILTIDGVGEWTTTSLAHGHDNQITILKEIHFPHSLGLLYSAFTYYTGFRVNSGEYKLMGLAPYGEAKYVQTIRDQLIDIRDDGSFRLNLDYFNYATGLTMTNRKFADLFGGPPRSPESPVTQREMDLARSVQVVTEEVMLKLARFAAQETGSRNLCLAGGVALNCVANGEILRQQIFERIWIQPAAGDAGGALGAAYSAYYQELQHPRTLESSGQDRMKGAYLGPSFGDLQISEYLDRVGAVYQLIPREEDLLQRLAQELAAGKVLGWFSGRMEFGPRALGARSILGDPRNPQMQSVMNLKIKYRESFRPFAPAVLRERLEEYFELAVDSPYMLLVAPVQPALRKALSPEQEGLFGIEKLKVPRSSIPAVTHVDYSARVQTVHGETNPRYHKLLQAFAEETGCAVLVNTSFNVRGEPIVCTPADAYRCFMGTEMDLLVMENLLLYKAEQPHNSSERSSLEEFALD